MIMLLKGRRIIENNQVFEFLQKQTGTCKICRAKDRTLLFHYINNKYSSQNLTIGINNSLHSEYIYIYIYIYKKKILQPGSPDEKHDSCDRVIASQHDYITRNRGKQSIIFT